jgi:serine/threonine protein kinase
MFFLIRCLDYGLDDLRRHAISVNSYVQSVEAYKRVYYAPELISINELKLTPPIDIYAFGIILNEIATRSEPFGVKNSFSFYIKITKIFTFRMMMLNQL